MDGGTLAETTPDGPRTPRPARRYTVGPILLVIALGGLALIAEKDSSESTKIAPAASVNVARILDRLADLPGLETGTPGGAAIARAREALERANARSDAATEAATRNVRTPEQAVTLADNLGSTALDTVNGVAAAAPSRAAALQGVAQQVGPLGFVCDILLAARARVIVRIQALVARFPFLSERLLRVQARVEARIGALLARFGCTISG